MIKLNTCFDSIIWTDLNEKITYLEVKNALNQKLTDNPAKNRHLKKIAFFVNLIKSNQNLEDNIISLQIINQNLFVGDGNHRLSAIEYIKNNS